MVLLEQRMADTDGDDLLRAVELATRRAKRAGAERPALFRAERDSERMRRGALAAQLPEALADNQFTLKRLQYKVGEGEWSDTDTVADDIVVHFRFTLPPR